MESEQRKTDEKINIKKKILKKVALIPVCIGIGTAVPCMNAHAEGEAAGQEIFASAEQTASSGESGNAEQSNSSQTSETIAATDTVTVNSIQSADDTSSGGNSSKTGATAKTDVSGQETGSAAEAVIEAGAGADTDTSTKADTDSDSGTSTAGNTGASSGDSASDQTSTVDDENGTAESSRVESASKKSTGEVAAAENSTEEAAAADNTAAESTEEEAAEEGDAASEESADESAEESTEESAEESVTEDSDSGSKSSSDSDASATQEYNPEDAANNGIRPQTYGARGDNEADDTAAFNEAVSHLSEEQNTIYIPAGTYRINAAASISLRSNINFVMDKDAKLVVIPNGGKSYKLLRLDTISNVRIYGGQLYGDRYGHTGTSGEWGHGICVLDSSDVTIDGVRIYDCWGDGIYLGTNIEDPTDPKAKTSGCKEIVIRNCVLSNNRRNDLSIVSADNVTIQNCSFNNANGTDPMAGIDIETNNSDNPNEHIIIDSCSFDGNAKGSILIETAADDVQINNSTLNGTFINFAGTNVKLSNTVINGRAHCRYGIVLSDGSKINDGGTADDTTVVDYHPSLEDIYGSDDKKSIVHKYYTDKENTIEIKSAEDEAYGTVLRFKRTSSGTHEAGILLDLAEITHGAFRKMVPGRTYRIEYAVRGNGNWAFNSNQLNFYWINPESSQDFTTCMVTYTAGRADSGKIWFYCMDEVYEKWLDIGEIWLKDLDYTGISKQEDGSYVYAKNGDIETGMTGFRKSPDDSNWWYFVEGKFDTGYCGAAKNGNELWYVTNGIHDTSYTGTGKDSRGWCYFTDGSVNPDYTGFGAVSGTGTDEDGTWYYYRGRIAYRVTGAVKTGSDWEYVSKGKKQDSYSGLAGGAGRSFLFKDGKVDTAFTGEASDDRGSWYIVNGEVAHSVSGMVKIGDLWRYVLRGKIETDYTGMVRNRDTEIPDAWCYFTNGAPDDSYTGVVMAFGRRYYFKNGRLDGSYTGTASDGKNTWYIIAGSPASSVTGAVASGSDVLYIRHGKVETGFTGMALDQNGVWRYFRNGKLVEDYTGIASNPYGFWYFSDGSVDQVYSGEAIDERGTWYFVHGRIAYGFTGIAKIGENWRYVVRGRVMTNYTGPVKYRNGWFYFRDGLLTEEKV